MVESYNEILNGNKKKELQIHAITCMNRHVEPKEPDTGGYILFDSIYVEFKNGQTNL